MLFRSLMDHPPPQPLSQISQKSTEQSKTVSQTSRLVEKSSQQGSAIQSIQSSQKQVVKPQPPSSNAQDNQRKSDLKVPSNPSGIKVSDKNIGKGSVITTTTTTTITRIGDKTSDKGSFLKPGAKSGTGEPDPSGKEVPSNRQVPKLNTNTLQAPTGGVVIETSQRSIKQTTHQIVKTTVNTSVKGPSRPSIPSTKPENDKPGKTPVKLTGQVNNAKTENPQPPNKNLTIVHTEETVKRGSVAVGDGKAKDLGSKGQSGMKGQTTF